MNDQLATQQDQRRIGVYVCHCGTNISGTVDVEQVARFAATLPGVVTAKTYRYMCSDPGQDLIKQDIEQLQLDRVVVASCSPLMHEPTFRATCEEAGLNRYLFQMANIREHCSWVHPDRHDATEKAERLVAAAVRRVWHHKAMEERKVPVRPEVLVVGGGIAGIEAALRIAHAGKKVYLVEREPSIGGHMAKFDKTFPTLDCAACILTPKMVNVSRHPNIELLTYSEVEEISGFVGNFTVRVRRKPRYVDVEKCTGCGDCVKACPVEAPDEFNEGLSTRKAIYRSFPQAVPNAFVIDKRGRAPCRAGCPAGVHTQGYIALIAERRFAEAAALVRRDLPLPSACGRVCYHPCEDQCERSQLDEPVAICALKRFVADWALEHDEQVEPLPTTQTEKVAVIGSGPAGLACANELAHRGYEVTVFEAAEKAGGMLRYGIPAYRLPEVILDRELGYLEKLGIRIETGQLVRSIRQLKQQGFRAVFLSTGAPLGMQLGIPGEELAGVTDVLEFLRQVNSGRLQQIEGRVAVIGGGNSAMDAARAARRLGAQQVTVVYRRSRAEMPAHDWEVAEAEAEGVEFLFLASPLRVEGQEGRAERLICQRMELGEPDASGRRRPVPVPDSQFELPVDLVIPAIGQSTDLGPIGEELETQRGRVKTDPVTLGTSMDGVFAGGDVVTGPATVVDAFAAGKRAAESIDRYLQGKDLRAGRDRLPPVAPQPDLARAECKPRQRPVELVADRRASSFEEIVGTLTEEQAVLEAGRCLGCGTCSECLECVDLCEAGAIDHNQQEEIRELEVGAVVVATGFQLFDPGKMVRYGFGRLPNVVHGLQFERMTHASGPTSGQLLTTEGKKPESVAIIHCVGSRDTNHHEYCSRVCCMYSLKFAHLVKEKTGAEVYNLYIDIRAPGKGYEEFYKRLLHEGVHFIRGKCAEVTDVAESPEEEGKLVVVCEDTLLGVTRRLPVDMVVLSPALEPADGADELSRRLSISCGQGSFFLERHPKLAPVEVASDGIFLAGACQGPKDIPDSVAQGAAAAACALSLIDGEVVVLEPITAEIDAERCSGCKVCISACPFDAITFDAEREASVVQEELCKGCGTCVAACPSGVAGQKSFEDEQIFAEIEGVLV